MTPNDLQNTASEALDTAAASSHEAADKTLRAASEALSQASARLNAARARAGETIDQWTERAQELSRNGLDKACDFLDCSKRGVRRAGDATSAYVEDQPLKSIAIAAGVGAATAALIMLLRNRDR